MVEQRTLGSTDIRVTPVAMGCWPIAGMTSLDVNERDSLKTLQMAWDCGINFFDTAYAYGANGESEQLIARAFQDKRDSVVIATKCGLAWDSNSQRVIDARPQTIKQQVDESLRRLRTDRVELLYLHTPDPKTPIVESARCLLDVLQSGKARSIGVSNFTLEQTIDFQQVCPISVLQPPYNMLQRDIESEIVPWCLENKISLATYWPLMKGLLAGQLSRDHVFQPGDGRAKYTMFQGQEWIRNQDLVDDLRSIANECDKTVSQIVVRWTIQQPGITAALCGAKRDYQIQETAHAMDFELSPAQLAQIDSALARRGSPVTNDAFSR